VSLSDNWTASFLTTHSNSEKVHKIVTTLDLKIPPRDLNSKEPRQLLSVIFTQWLSLSTCIIQAAIDVIPAPPVSQATRLPKILYPDLREKFKSPKNKLEEDLYSSRSDPDAYVVAYVSKMFVVSYKDMPEKKRKTQSAEEPRTRGIDLQDTHQGTTEASDPLQENIENTEGEVVLGFARLYAGTIRVGCSVYAVLPKYKTALGPSDPSNAEYILPAEVQGLYIMMGRQLVPVQEVRAGNIFAIRGLESKVFRSATLCSPGLLASGDSSDKKSRMDCLINLGGVNRAVSAISLTWIGSKNNDYRPRPLFGWHWNQQSPLTCQDLLRASNSSSSQIPAWRPFSNKQENM
jgi:ribosome assembly protein 1